MVKRRSRRSIAKPAGSVCSRRIALWSQSTSTMLRSSDESRQSSDGSEPRIVASLGWLEGRVAPFAKRFGNAPAVLALREAVPISFGGLLVALAVLMLFFEPGSLVDRLKHAIPGAFA